MALQDLEKKILGQAEAAAGKIKVEADKNLALLEKQHREQKEQLRAEILMAARQKAEEVKRSYLLPARLSAKKALLEQKQKILSQIYQEVQKEKKLSDAELNQLREKSEVKVAKILYG